MRRLLFPLIMCVTFFAEAQTNPPAFVQKVYDDIFNTMNDGKVIRPRVVMSDKPSEVATYDPTGSEPLIKLGVNFIALVRNFGSDSSNAIAHVLGHELAHVILRQNDLINSIGSGYASADYNNGIKKFKKVLQDSVFERQADEFSAFFAHMAGYQTTGIGEILLDSIYRRFNLNDKKLSRYPKLTERKEIVKHAERKMSVLKMFFDASIFCILSENYEMSDAFNRAIIRENFPSREVHNNLGVTYLIKGISLLDSIDFPYQFPISIDVSTRLSSSPERSLDDDARSYLQQSIHHFQNAIQCSESYEIAWLNKAIAHFILGEYDSYDIALIKLKNPSSEEIKNKIHILKTIKEHYSSANTSTISYEELCSSGNTYACTKIKQINTSTPTIRWPKNLIEYRDYQNPRFDFFNEDAKKADTLHKLLSVVKNDFRYRKINSGNIIGEKWYFPKINIKPIEIYTLKSIQLDELEFGFIDTNFTFLGVFANKKYFKFNNVYVVLIGHNATFYYLI